MSNTVVLELEAKEVARASDQPPFFFDVGAVAGRKLLDDVQRLAASAEAIEVEDRRVGGGPRGSVTVRIVRPPDVARQAPVILYMHGGGWVFGGAVTHDRLIRELAVDSSSVVVFPIYSLSPEARYPVALEECLATLAWIAAEGPGLGLDPARITVAGDSAGGNLATAVALSARKKGGPSIARQLLFYPVTDAGLDTPSYREFATGFGLRRDVMKWLWDQYLPDLRSRDAITVSPLRATLEDLRGLPPALVITAEADVLRDEGEAYARKLLEAGVRVTSVRFNGTIHDFVMLNSLAESTATRAAMALAAAWLKAD